MGLTHLDVGNKDPLLDTLSYYEPILDAYTETYDVQELFTPENTPYSVAGTIITRDNVKIDVGYSSGINTDKLDITSGYTLGVTKYMSTGDRDQHGFLIGASTTFGGKYKHSPCVASYAIDEIDQTEHACVDGLPLWEDHAFDKHEQPYNVTFRYTYRF